MSPDAEVELDGVKLKMRDVPKERLPDVVVELDGSRVRPYRFVSVDESPFSVIR